MKTKFILISVLLLGVVSLYGIYLHLEKNNPNKCFSMSNSYSKIQCLIPYFLNFAKDKSPLEAIDLSQKYEDIGKIDDCHLISHAIGEEITKVNNFDFAKSFSLCSEACAQGCYHGVMQSYIAKTLDPQSAVEKAPHLCDPLEEDYVQYRQCVHGLGHGLVAHDYMYVNEAVKVCNKFDSQRFATDCKGGVYMENMDKYLQLDKQKLLEQMSIMCEDAKEFGEDHYLFCIRAVGEGLMFFTGHNLDEAIEMCGVYDGEAKEKCIDATKHELLMERPSPDRFRTEEFKELLQKETEN